MASRREAGLAVTDLSGRRRELGQLRWALSQETGSVVQVAGPVGSGKSALVEAAASGFRSIRHRAPPLPESRLRLALARDLGMAHGWEGEPDGVTREGTSTWEALGARVAGMAGDRSDPFVLIVDDAHRWSEARARVESFMRAALAGKPGRPVHVVLVGKRSGLPATPEGLTQGPRLELGPLTFRAVAPVLPGSSPRDRLRAYAVFGGMPEVMRHLDPAATLATNVRRLVADPDGPFHRYGVQILEREVQAPARYAAILGALSRGEADWGSIHAAVPDLTASGQLAPYLKRLEALGLVEVQESLDARRGSRSRRYRIRDPFLAFWFRFALEGTHAAADRPGWVRGSGADIDDHIRTVLPLALTQYMGSDVVERLGANAREVGGLWGPGYDLPLAGVLTSGAVFYGLGAWAGEAMGVASLEALDRQVRETRYGFGRERRLRVLFSGWGFRADLVRLAARRDDVVLLQPEDLIG